MLFALNDQMTSPTTGDTCSRGWAAMVGVLTALLLTATMIRALPAGAEVLSPQWTVTAVSRPTNVNPAVAVDEVQEISVSATGGNVVVIEPVSLEELQAGKIELSELKTAEFVYNASREVAQTALESLYGSGNVEVSGGPPGAYVVTFTGALGNRPVRLMNTEFSGFLGGLEGEAVTTRAKEGKPAGEYVVEVKNTGGAASNGSTVTITDTLPAGLILAGQVAGSDVLSTNAVSCVATTCTYSGVIVPDDSLILRVPVAVGAGPFADSCELPAAAIGCLTNGVAVHGGGAPEAGRETPTVISARPAEFGIAPGSLSTVLSSTQAGAHADLTTSLAFDTLDTNGKLPASPRSTTADLPPGFVGDLADSPTCSVATFDEQAGLFQGPQYCGLSTQVGTTTVELGFGTQITHVTAPVYNLTPNPGELAKLGFAVPAVKVMGTISLRPGDYGVRTSFENIVGAANLDAVSLTIWGVPAAASHNQMRGLICNGLACAYFALPTPGNENGEHNVAELPGGQVSSSPAVPFLTSPTQCTGAPLQAVFAVGAWEPGVESVSESSPLGPLTGCDLLEFPPFIVASPDTGRTDTPAGLTAEVRMPQEGLISAEGFSAADLKNTTVKLPVGMVVNPGQAAGLAACQLSEAGIGREGPASCSNASKVGTVEVDTPVLKHKLDGNVYLLQSNPPDLKLLVTAYAPIYGIYVKLIGDVHLDLVTGQLTTTFEGTPELPFDDFKLSFSGGAQAALSTPTHCGTYTTNADFTPWTSPIGPDALSMSEFVISSGTNGAACPGSSLPFTPSLIAGATTDQAGGFTHFSMLLQSPDDQQRIEKLQFKAPPGLSGVLSSVPLCGEPQAAQGTCPASSQIGHTVIASGPGPYPLVVPQPGQPPAAIYLTGPYQGAPFGLSIVVPVVVGPFVLETQVVRARIEVDPATAQITVTTSPLPQIIDGVPTDLRTVNAVIDRPGFMFNPTNCSAQAFSGTATSSEGTDAPISSRFQVGSCQSLKFTPKFALSTTGHSTRATGASFTAKISEPKGAMGTQANIRSVKVALPRALPSRLSTLQKACLAAVFDANPAACPAGSIVGHARAVTPILPGALTGPAYFVSNGGAKFPELVIVLQGDGVTIVLHGETDIKAGVTSSTFHTVPDQPVTSFELTLPQGKGSALAANLPAKAKGNFCGQHLTAPTALVAQNGLEIHQNTPVAVTGCSGRAQRLAAALKACKRKPKGKRAACALAAHRKYGTLKKG